MYTLMWQVRRYTLTVVYIMMHIHCLLCTIISRQSPVLPVQGEQGVQASLVAPRECRRSKGSTGGCGAYCGQRKGPVSEACSRGVDEVVRGWPPWWRGRPASTHQPAQPARPSWRLKCPWHPVSTVRSATYPATPWPCSGRLGGS